MPPAKNDRCRRTGLLLLLVAGLMLLGAAGWHLRTPERFTAESLLLLQDIVYGKADPNRPPTADVLAAGEDRLRASLPSQDPTVSLRRHSGSARLYVLSASGPTPEAAVATAGTHTRETIDRYVGIYRAGRGGPPSPVLPNVSILKMPTLPQRPDRVTPWPIVLASTGACTLAGLALLFQGRCRVRPAG